MELVLTVWLWVWVVLGGAEMVCCVVVLLVVTVDDRAELVVADVTGLVIVAGLVVVETELVENGTVGSLEVVVPVLNGVDV